MATPDPTKVGTLYRDAAITRLDRAADAAADAPQLFEVAVSTEAEISRWYGIEILSHDPGAVDLSRMRRGAAVLLDHRAEDLVGVVRSARLDSDKVLRATIQFSRSPRGQQIQQDVIDGIRQSVSVGYSIQDLQPDGRKNGVEVFRAARWQPMEVSLVSVPADVNAGVGRGAERTSRMEIENNDAVNAERERIARIYQTVEGRGIAPEQVQKWITDGASPSDVARVVLERVRTRGTATPHAEALDGLNDRERRSYSIQRAILVAAGEAQGGLEFDVSRELERRLPPDAKRHAGSVLVPMDLRSRDQQLAHRALTSNTITKGAEAIIETGGEMIELLRNRTSVIQLGARVLTGLTAPIAFPKQTGAMTAYWVGENPSSDVTASDPTLGMVLMSARTLQGTTSYSRQFLAQASIGGEEFVRSDIAMVHSIAIDRASLHGLGAAGEPTGIYAAPNVNSTAIGGAMTYAKLLSMLGSVASANADRGALGWLMNPTMATNLKGTQDFPTASAGRPIWTGTYEAGEVAGYRAVASNQVSKTMTGSNPTGGSEIGTLFGDWSQLVIGSWSALEIIVDPYSLKKRGIIECTSFQMVDLIVRHGESFAKSTGATG